MTIAQRSLELTGLFEADLLVELMLRYWQHPLANDSDFRNNLLEAAADALRASIQGQLLYEDIRPENMNLIAAVAYVESVTLESDPEIDSGQRDARFQWLERTKKAIPSCF